MRARTYILVYYWEDKNGNAGYGNQSVEINVKRLTVRQLGSMIEDIKQKDGYKEIVVLNMIKMGDEEE